MAQGRETKGAVDTLDDLVKEFTLRAVLRMLTEVCYRRVNRATGADHVSNATECYRWREASKLVEKTATGAFRLGV